MVRSFVRSFDCCWLQKAIKKGTKEKKRKEKGGRVDRWVLACVDVICVRGGLKERRKSSPTIMQSHTTSHSSSITAQKDKQIPYPLQDPHKGFRPSVGDTFHETSEPKRKPGR